MIEYLRGLMLIQMGNPKQVEAGKELRERMQHACRRLLVRPGHPNDQGVQRRGHRHPRRLAAILDARAGVGGGTGRHDG